VWFKHPYCKSVLTVSTDVTFHIIAPFGRMQGEKATVKVFKGPEIYTQQALRQTAMEK
jgi:hypothetical protein